MIESQVRLFLSVDISGSTKLKNIKNYIKMVNRSKDLSSLCCEIQKKNPSLSIDDAIKHRIIQTENLDWVKTISDTFMDFHSFFTKESKLADFFPWKVLGDELIYSINVTNRNDLHKYLLAFYKSIREFDNRLNQGNEIRLKGCAWTAGFPIKNRIIEIPSPDLYFRNSEGIEQKYAYPREDYIGPEMDIGFRLGKCVWPGFLVISIELAYLLSTVDCSDQFNMVNVGWEMLKGVWGERCYPIYWLYLPTNIKDLPQYSYNEYYEWETENDKFLKEWNKQKDSLKEIKTYKKTIENIFEKLPNELGVELPYFSSSDKIPKRHSEILELLCQLEIFMKNSNKQNNEDEKGVAGSSDLDGKIKSVENIFNEF